MDRLGLLGPHPHVTLGLHILLRCRRLATTTNKTKNETKNTHQKRTSVFRTFLCCFFFVCHPTIKPFLVLFCLSFFGWLCGHPWISAIRTYLSPFTKDNRVLIHSWDFRNFCRAFRPAQENQRKDSENIAGPEASPVQPRNMNTVCFAVLLCRYLPGIPPPHEGTRGNPC